MSIKSHYRCTLENSLRCISNILCKRPWLYIEEIIKWICFSCKKSTWLIIAKFKWCHMHCASVDEQSFQCFRRFPYIRPKHIISSREKGSPFLRGQLLELREVTYIHQTQLAKMIQTPPTYGAPRIRLILGNFTWILRSVIFVDF